MKVELPSIPLEAWEKSKKTLHFYLQIIGKVQLKLNVPKNHWWHITEHINTVGITTNGIPYKNGIAQFEITLNLVKHCLELTTSEGDYFSFQLEDGLSVAKFKENLFGLLSKIGVEPNIVNKPFDLGTDVPFDLIEDHHSYDKEYVNKYWRVLLWVDKVFKEFSGDFYGKQCPVHMYWHHMDLAVTRFSGKKGPGVEGMSRASDKDAYSHEVISFGFWAGDDLVREPAFYAYAYPSPPAIDKEPLSPDYANWVDSNGSPMAYLSYEKLRTAENPKGDLLEFLNSAYLAGARLANWDIEEFKFNPF